eukprot:TRINITY_DN58966_c0_g1_i1.p1 TRINITY_DN58966_c0_g1~~TRINITY_DN58966_c0_g1_i1.p1  ORF type:complete len:240 (-),score=29.79 TRINITY_DN58966_c0_g1_i1:8-664(-)
MDRFLSFVFISTSFVTSFAISNRRDLPLGENLGRDLTAALGGKSSSSTSIAVGNRQVALHSEVNGSTASAFLASLTDSSWLPSSDCVGRFGSSLRNASPAEKIAMLCYIWLFVLFIICYVFSDKILEAYLNVTTAPETKSLDSPVEQTSEESMRNSNLFIGQSSVTNHFDPFDFKTFKPAPGKAHWQKNSNDKGSTNSSNNNSSNNSSSNNGSSTTTQ